MLLGYFSCGLIWRWSKGQGFGGLQAAKVLANAVIPNEYGIEPQSKLSIGSRICAALLGKILADLGNMREESIATAHVQVTTCCIRQVVTDYKLSRYNE